MGRTLMGQIITYNLRNLFNFNGRQTRGQFWPYVGVVFLVTMAAYMAALIPLFVSILQDAQQFAAENPEQVVIQQGSEHYSMQIEGAPPPFVPDFSSFLVANMVICLGAILLLAAAVSRRLHDTDRTGAWGAIPAVLLLFCASMMWSQFGDIASADAAADTGAFLAMFLGNLLYLVSLAVLIVLLCMAGTNGPNRFGEPVG